MQRPHSHTSNPHAYPAPNRYTHGTTNRHAHTSADSHPNADVYARTAVRDSLGKSIE